MFALHLAAPSLSPPIAAGRTGEAARAAPPAFALQHAAQGRDRRLVDQGLLVRTGDRLRVTETGMLLLDAILAEIVAV